MSKDQKKSVKLFLAKIMVAALELRLEMLNQDMVTTAGLYRRAVEDLADLHLRAQVDDEAQSLLADVLKKAS